MSHTQDKPSVHAFDVSIVIACYNEEDQLVAGVEEIAKVMEQTKYSWELIFVDDGSQDRTRELIRSLCIDHPNRSYLFHAENVGRGGTVMDGFRMAKGAVAGFLDIDLEVHARHIPSMLHAIIVDSYDVATADRIYKRQFHITHLFRFLLSVGYRKLVKMALKLPLRDTETGFKFFKMESAFEILERTQHNGWFWDTEVMALCHYSGLRMIEIPCPFVRRRDKKSTTRPIRDSVRHFRHLLQFKNQEGNRRG